MHTYPAITAAEIGAALTVRCADMASISVNEITTALDDGPAPAAALEDFESWLDSLDDCELALVSGEYNELPHDQQDDVAEVLRDRFIRRAFEKFDD